MAEKHGICVGASLGTPKLYRYLSDSGMSTFQNFGEMLSDMTKKLVADASGEYYITFEIERDIPRSERESLKNIIELQNDRVFYRENSR
jgi:hypothetical protein